jgi:hypothetical protein
MEFRIRILREGHTVRAGHWSGNLHTAVTRALTGFPCQSRGVAHTGDPKDWTRLGIGERITVEVERV